MPIWIDLKGVPSLLFSHKALKCLSRATGKFVKLHPHTEKFTRLDVARVLVEVNLNKPLVEKISCLDKDGATVMIEVYYPWLPPKCSICNAWGNQGSNCKSKRITMLQKDKEVEVPKEDAVVGDVVITGDEVPKAVEGLDGALGRNDVVISPSRFSVLALEEIEEDGANEEEDLEEGEVVADFPIEETKMKDPARTGRFRPGPTLSRFHAKLKTLKYDMRMLNKTHYGDLPARTKEAFEEMCRCQNMVLLDPNPVTFAAAAEASDHWNKLASIEEKFYRQQSCLRWLGAGDYNTVFFHRAVQTRSSKNTIRFLVKEAVLHFQRFLQMEKNDNGEDYLPLIQELLTYRCSAGTVATLVAPVSPEEITSALHTLPNDKVRTSIYC
ncbi:hypothetical protein F2Q69_00024080 [Brassica cretica]|uniref:DUF4283 domain-containing protein n=1 Tax=Brassica cretica TaxID=69181 RepID=A0A8S9QJ36_BRACR|nr:hypothetical protein F2Q69_00024080 [Brassica cretica]